jgi:hypothetical protein
LPVHALGALVTEKRFLDSARCFAEYGLHFSISFGGERIPGKMPFLGWPDNLIEREAVSLVVPAGESDGVLIVVLGYLHKAASESLEQIFIDRVEINLPPRGKCGGDAAKNLMCDRRFQSHDQKLGIFPRRVYTNREGVLRLILVGKDIERMPSELFDVGDHFSFGIVRAYSLYHLRRKVHLNGEYS